MQDAGTDVANAMTSMGSAALAVAFAGLKLADAGLSDLAGIQKVEFAYVLYGAFEELPHLASQCTSGPMVLGWRSSELRSQSCGVRGSCATDACCLVLAICE